jgi:hypothetical protein
MQVAGIVGMQHVTNAKVSSGPTSQTSNTFRYPGATPSISANGTGNAIVWAAENTNPAHKDSPAGRCISRMGLHATF